MAGIFDEDVNGPTPAPPQAPLGPALPKGVVAQPRPSFDEDVNGPVISEPDPNAVRWDRMNKPFGELKPADVSPTQMAKWGVQDALMGLGASPYNAGRMGGIAVDMSKSNPFIGTPLAAADTGYDIGQGKPVAAAIDATGMIPGALAARRALSGMPQMATAAVPRGRGDISYLPERGAPDPYGMGPYGLRGQQPAIPPANQQDELLQAGRGQYRDTRYSPVEYHPNAMNDFTWRAKQGLEHPELGFSPEKAPGIHATLDRWVGRMAYRNTPITAADWDGLRQQVKGFEGPDGAAGRHVANWIDAYMVNPPRGALIRGTQADLDTLRNNFDFARGNWRAGKTAETVEREIDRAGTKSGARYSGRNTANITQQQLTALTTTDAGANKIFGARPDEIAAINAVGQDPLTNRARYWSNKLAGGGGAGSTGLGIMAGSAGTAAGHMMGLDPYTSMAMGTATGLGVGKLGNTLRNVANERTVRAAEGVVDQIRRNSPEYAARVRASPPITDPFAMRRDAIAYALLPQVGRAGNAVWGQGHVPYANRGENYDPTLEQP